MDKDIFTAVAAAVDAAADKLAKERAAAVAAAKEVAAAAAASAKAAALQSTMIQGGLKNLDSNQVSPPFCFQDLVDHPTHAVLCVRYVRGVRERHRNIIYHATQIHLLLLLFVLLTQW